ncbi:MAG: PEP-CTERM sorting domain-containing protein [Phycisphaeraceae bacterium]|nr:PEP-CTERM sorting domain-containing protein [Phycisphaeraceae bacterium]
MKRWALGIAAALSSAWVSTSVASVYTFESLSTGAIATQDNWTSYAGVASVGTPSGTGNPSTRVFVGSGLESFGSRINNGSFSIPTFTGSETAAVLQFDFRLPTGGNRQATFGVGYDVNGSGSVQAGVALKELSPVIGADYYSGTPHFMVMINGGTFFLSYTTFPSGFAVGDWIRVRLDMDLTANSGNGSGVLSAQNLTTSGAMTAITGPLNLSLLTSGPAPSLWNAMYAEAYGGASGGQSDNLTVLVPEPASLGLLALGAVMIFPRKRHG